MKTRFLKHLTPRVALVIPWFVLGTLLCWPAFELGLLLHEYSLGTQLAHGLP